MARCEAAERRAARTAAQQAAPNQVRQVVVRHVAEAEAGAGGALSRFIMVVLLLEYLLLTMLT